MRILHVAPPWFAVPPQGYGGIEWIVAELADGMVDRGHDCVLLASGGSRTKAEFWTVFDEPPSEAIGSALMETVHCVRAYASRDGFDVIHDHSGAVGPALGAFTDGPPVVHTLHGPWSPELTQLYRSLPSRLHLVAISEDQRSRASAGVTVDAVVPNAVPLESFPFRPERRDGDGRLLFVGRSTPDKGPEVAVEVARRLRRPLTMVVKADEPPEQRHWRDRVEPLLDGADVEIVSGVSAARKAALMADADALLFPIRWEEPFGLVMVEAMACGTPVVAFANGASGEVVEHGTTGFLVEEGDVEAFCAAVSRVDTIEPAACRSRVQARYAKDRMIDGYEAVYQRLVTSPGHGHPGVVDRFAAHEGSPG